MTVTARFQFTGWAEPDADLPAVQRDILRSSGLELGWDDPWFEADLRLYRLVGAAEQGYERVADAAADALRAAGGIAVGAELTPPDPLDDGPFHVEFSARGTDIAIHQLRIASLTLKIPDADLAPPSGSTTTATLDIACWIDPDRSPEPALERLRHALDLPHIAWQDGTEPMRGTATLHHADVPAAMLASLIAIGGVSRYANLHPPRPTGPDRWRLGYSSGAEFTLLPGVRMLEIWSDLTR